MKNLPIEIAYKTIISGIEPFVHLSSSSFDELSCALDLKVYSLEEEEILFSQGDKCTRMYILLEGSFRCERIDANGTSIVLGYENTPGVFALCPLFDGENSFRTTFISSGRSIVASVTKDSIMKALSIHNELLLPFLRMVSSSCCRYADRLDILSMKTVRGRICVYLDKHKTGQDSMIIHTQTQLSDYLGVSRPALSSEINKMERDGIIRRKGKNGITILKNLADYLQ